MLLEQNPAAAGAACGGRISKGSWPTWQKVRRPPGPPLPDPGGRRTGRVRGHETAGPVPVRAQAPVHPPPFRGQGLARRLVEQLLTDAREEGVRGHLLDTFPFLSQAIRLYRALGFYEIPRYNSFGRSLIYMQKDLKPA